MKAFLSENKVYFETVAAAALTFMGLMVSIKPCEISNNELEVSSRELEIKEKELAPNFKFNYWVGRYFPNHEYYYDEEDMPSKNRSLTIYTSQRS